MPPSRSIRSLMRPRRSWHPQDHHRTSSMLVNNTSTTRPPLVLYQTPPSPIRAPAPPPLEELEPPSTAMPTGSYLMTSSFSYRKLKKLPSHQEEHDQQQPPSATSIQDYYHSYYRALGAAVARRAPWRRQRGRATSRAWGRQRRLRISSLARALRRKAAAVGGRVRASVAKVAARLMEGRPYIGDLFAGNYMFMQVAPSPTMAAGLDGGDKGFVPFTEYYYGKMKSRPVPGALQQLHPAAAAQSTT